MSGRIAVIPAYQPEEILIRVLQEIRKTGMEAIVVDDGSGREYAMTLLRATDYATVLTSPRNMGKGCALKKAFAYIEANRDIDDVTVVTMDADGQHTAADALNVLRTAEAHPGELVLGCRELPHSAPLRSRAGNAITRRVYRLSTGSSVSDTQTGLRAFDGSLLPVFTETEGSRYEYEMNVLLECPRRGIPIREIPIEAIYLARNETSHFNAVTDSIRIYREILRFAFSSLTGFAVDYSLYSLLVYLTVGLGTAPSVTLSNIAARVVSAAVNYAVNRRFVFKSKNNAVKSALSYAALAACILAGNTVLLNALVEAAGMNRYAAKLITELTFFSVSWLIQRSLIFRKDDGKAGRRPAGKGSFSAGRKYLRGGQQAEQMRIAEGLGAAGGR